jgi:hypothetical protein
MVARRDGEGDAARSRRIEGGNGMNKEVIK